MPKPPPSPVPRHPRPADLAARLELLRADYREGDVAAAERHATELAAELGRVLTSAKPLDPWLRSIAGSTATVRGLVGLLSGDSPTALFRDAVAEFDQVPNLVLRKGQPCADYGVALAFAGEPERAVPVLESAISLGEDTPDVRRALATALRDSGAVDHALSAFREVVERAPGDWQAHRALAELAERLDEAAAAATEWLATAEAMVTAGRPVEAADACRRATALTPAIGTEGELLFARVCVEIGEYAAAEARLDALDVAGTPAHLIAAAELYTQLGAFDKAEERVTAVLAAEPDHREATLLRIRLLLAMDETDRARSTAEELAGRAPDDPRVHALLGMAAHQAGDPAAAAEALDRANELDPGDPFVLANLGAALAAQGEFEQAGRIVAGVLADGMADAWVLDLHARILVSLGRFADAETDLRAALDQEPDRTDTRALLGETLCVLGAHEQALAEIDRALADDPAIDWAWVTRGDLLAATGDLAAARESFERAMRQNATHVPALTGLADVLLSSGEPDGTAEAERLVHAALRLDQASSIAHALLGEIRRRQGRYDEALVSLDEATALVPNYAYAWATRGMALGALDRIPDAIAAFTLAAESGYDPDWVHTRLAEAHLTLAAAGQESAVDTALTHLRAASKTPQILVRTAEALCMTNSYDEARDALDQAVEQLTSTAGAENAELVEALTLRGEVQLRQGEVAAATADLRRAIDLGENRVVARALLAEALYRSGSDTEAIAEADAVLAQDPAHRDALAVRGASRAALGDLDAALVDLRVAWTRDPGDLFVSNQLRIALGAAGRHEDAVAAMGAAVAAAPGDKDLVAELAWALAGKAEALLAAGDHRQALGVLDDLLWQTPDHPYGLRLLGRVLIAAGRHDEAVTTLERAVELTADDRGPVIDLAEELARIGDFETALARLDSVRPPESAVFTARANILADVGRWSEAVEAAREAVAADGADLWAHSALGWALQHGDVIDPAGSKEAFEHAVRLAPEDPWAHKGLANALYLLGDRAGARAEYEWVADRLVDVSPRDPYHNALRGWCLFRLARYRSAIGCLQRAVDEPVLRFGVLLDLMLVHLGLDEYDQAERTYAVLEAELATIDPNRRRGIRSVGLDNLRSAVASELAGNPVAHRLLEKLTAAHDG